MILARKAIALALFLASFTQAARAAPPADTLRVLFTFDARGKLPILGEAGGDSTHLREALRWARIAAENDRPGGLLLDCGNTFFPGALSRFSYGSAMNEILGLAGASAKRVTRRDFLMGEAALRSLQRKSSAAFLASNVSTFPASVSLKRAGRSVIV